MDVCESVRVHCVVARGWPTAFDDDESPRQDASAGCAAGRKVLAVSRDDMNACGGGITSPSIFGDCVRETCRCRIQPRNNPLLFGGGPDVCPGAQREARRNGGSCVPYE